MELSQHEIDEAVERALTEDLGDGDVTSALTIPEGTTATATVVAREPMVVAGLDVARRAFERTCDDGKVECLAEDGQEVVPGTVLMRLSGPARGILSGERVALNFLQRLCGVATLTSHYVKAVAGTGVKILDTRKTTPGLRRLEKYAVACGGGVNHRMGLYDQVMIKDNHLAALAATEEDPIGVAVARARAGAKGLLVEVEADTLEQAERAAVARPDYILLDNMTPERLREAVRVIGRRARTEASGGVTLAAVREIAETGVDAISIGALTHSARAVDLGLDFVLGAGHDD